MAASIDIDQDWRAESDAHTLAEAEEIKADQDRLTAAVEAGKKLSEESSKRASRMKVIANQLYPNMQG